MKNLKRKGFTIVELVIVIAVIAVLAAVLIPTFVNLTKKANLSADQQMVRNMNTTLAVEGALENGFAYAGDAIEALNVNGFSGKYSAYSSKHYYGYDFEGNKMYLVNDKNEVIYPDNKVQVSDLWFLWSNNAVDKVAGATKYIALTSIVGESGYYYNHFNDGTNYTIDLGGKFIDVDNELSNVKAVNGVVISGASKGEGVTEMVSSTVSDVVSGTTIENKVFNYTKELRTKVESTANVTYKNCYFYNWIGEGAGVMNNITFDGCVFVDTPTGSYVFNIQGDSDKAYEKTLTVKNCTFTNCARIFNIPLFTKGEDNPGSITIIGNTFNPVTEKDRPVIQLASQVSPNGDSSTRGYININISDNKFTGIASTQAGLITLRESIIPLGDLSADYITFKNNTISETIPADKYVVNDDGKPDSNFNNYQIDEFKKALIQKIIASK